MFYSILLLLEHVDANGSEHAGLNTNQAHVSSPDSTPPPVTDQWTIVPNLDTQEEGLVANRAIPSTSTNVDPTPESIHNEVLTPTINPDAPVEPVDDTPTVPELDSELLMALGETTEDAPKFGPNIHPILADRWQPILRRGISKEAKESLMKEYLVPENCPYLHAPKLNAEISAAITDLSRNRDKKMETAQQQLGVGITAINKALTLLLTGDDKVQAIKHLSDSCRILTDLHCYETKTRIKVITPSLAKSFHKVIQDSERDETLFGNKLPDKIKASKAIEKQGLEIKKTAPNANKGAASTSTGTSAASRANYQYQGNWQAPPRFPSNRGGRGGPRKPAPAGFPRITTPHQPQTRAAGQSKPRPAARQ